MIHSRAQDVDHHISDTHMHINNTTTTTVNGQHLPIVDNGNEDYKQKRKLVDFSNTHDVRRISRDTRSSSILQLQQEQPPVTWYLNTDGDDITRFNSRKSITSTLMLGGQPTVDSNDAMNYIHNSANTNQYNTVNEQNHSNHDGKEYMDYDDQHGSHQSHTYIMTSSEYEEYILEILLVYGGRISCKLG